MRFFFLSKKGGRKREKKRLGNVRAQSALVNIQEEKKE